MIWYGRWVSSYKDGDLVQFVKKSDGKIGIGALRLPDVHFSERYFVEDKFGKTYTNNELLVVSPFNYWYRDHSDLLYDAILNKFLNKAE